LLCFVFVLFWIHIGAAATESSVVLMPPSDATREWNRANLVFVAWGLLAIAALLGLGRWRTLRRRQQRETEKPGSPFGPDAATDDQTKETAGHSKKYGSGGSNNPVAQSAVSSTPDNGLDLQLLRYLSEGTAEGFSTQIDIYLKAFNSDLRAARLIFAQGDQKKIHHIAHRLVAHAGAVSCIPLVDLATGVQSAAAALTPQQLDQAIRDIDREFAILTSKLDALRASTGPA
jgi:hypothetical protein